MFFFQLESITFHQDASAYCFRLVFVVERSWRINNFSLAGALNLHLDGILQRGWGGGEGGSMNVRD